MKHIKCKTIEQLRKVLKKLENGGYRWAGGQKPTEYVPFDSYGEDTVIEVDDERRDLTYCSYGYFVDTQKVKTFIDAEDFVRNEKKRPSIVIFRRGREVIAKDVSTGDEGVAKCSPDDEFVFKTGASIALARLMAKTPDVLNHDVKDEWIKVLGLTPVKKKPEAKFEFGDYVTLKEGIEANKKYGGLPLLEGAMYDNAYNKRMTVVHVDWSDDSNTYYCECKGDSQFTFHYSEQMLDKWDESVIHEGDKVRIKKRCTGMRYDTYFEWVNEYITDPELLLAFEREDHVDTSLDYKVVKIAPHKLFSQKPVAYIKHKGDYRTICYLFDVEALEKV